MMSYCKKCCLIGAFVFILPTFGWAFCPPESGNKNRAADYAVALSDALVYLKSSQDSLLDRKNASSGTLYMTTIKESVLELDCALIHIKPYVASDRTEISSAAKRMEGIITVMREESAHMADLLRASLNEDVAPQKPGTIADSESDRAVKIAEALKDIGLAIVDAGRAIGIGIDPKNPKVVLSKLTKAESKLAIDHLKYGKFKLPSKKGEHRALEASAGLYFDLLRNKSGKWKAALSPESSN